MRTTGKYIIKNIFFISILLFVCSFQIPQNTFEDLLYNNPNLQVNQWDVAQVILGFYTNLAKTTYTYLDLENIMQLFIPLTFQLLGILLSVRFLLYPLSFHVFIKSKISKKKQYYLFFLKKSLLDATIYVFSLLLVVFSIIETTSITSDVSTFNYQDGNIVISLLLYAIMFFIMLMSVSTFIFIGYIRNKSLLYLFLSTGLLILLNIADRLLQRFNLILFDHKNLFLDSIIFWGIILLIEWIYLRNSKLTQEDYND